MSKLMLRKSSMLSAVIAAVLLTAGCSGDGESEAKQASQTSGDIELDTTQKQVTYIVGYNMAEQAKANGVEFVKDVMAVAIEDVQTGKEPRIEQAEQQSIMMAFQEEQQQQREAEMQEAGKENLAESEAFLEENKEKEGVEVTESGLQYKVLESGEEGAESPGPEDTVKVHYHGTLIDGTVFDSSVERGEPISIPVGGVIPGWIEALQLMSVGDKYELYIPAELAYGPSGSGEKIGPNEALIFQVELLEINPEVEGHGHGGS